MLSACRLSCTSGVVFQSGTGAGGAGRAAGRPAAVSAASLVLCFRAVPELAGPAEPPGAQLPSQMQVWCCVSERYRSWRGRPSRRAPSCRLSCMSGVVFQSGTGAGGAGRAAGRPAAVSAACLVLCFRAEPELAGPAEPPGAQLPSQLHVWCCVSERYRSWRGRPSRRAPSCRLSCTSGVVFQSGTGAGGAGRAAGRPAAVSAACLVLCFRAEPELAGPAEPPGAQLTIDRHRRWQDIEAEWAQSEQQEQETEAEQEQQEEAVGVTRLEVGGRPPEPPPPPPGPPPPPPPALLRGQGDGSSEEAAEKSAADDADCDRQVCVPAQTVLQHEGTLNSPLRRYIPLLRYSFLVRTLGQANYLATSSLFKYSMLGSIRQTRNSQRHLFRSSSPQFH